MSYIGQAPIEEFSSVPTKDSFTGDGSTVAFDLSNQVAAAGDNSIEVFVDNVRQEPGSSKAYTLGVDGSGDMKRVTFTTAPASSAVIYVLNSYTNTFALPAFADINAAELILDADGDTSITADTDDRIDVKVSGTDQIQIADGVVKPVTDSDVDLGTSSLYFKNAWIDAITTTGNVTVGGDLTITGTTSFADTNITNVGSIALDTITNDGTDITLDSGGDIILDADGTQVFLKDGGTLFGSLTQVGGQLVIKSSSSDTTALTFAGANSTLAGTLGVGAVTSTGVVTATGFTIGSAVITEAELEILDGATVTTTELNLIDGGTSRGTTAVASGDGILINDAGTMAMTNVDTVSTYFASHNVGGGNIVTTGALNSGSITSGFGTINNGSSTITTTGAVATGALSVTGATTVSTTLGVTGVATFSGGATLTEGTLTDQSTVTWDAATDPVAKVTLAANRTLASATNGGTGQFISLLIIQDGTGSRTLTWNAAYEFKDDTAPTLTTTAAKGDLFVFRYNGSKWLEVGRNTALTLS